MYNEEQYDIIKSFFTKNNLRFRLLKTVYKLFPLVLLVCYPALLLYELITHDERLIRCVAVPLGVFISVSIFRGILNLERPYQRLDIEPLIPKSKQGKSFPSRHTACAAVIAMTFLYVQPWVGVIFLVMALLIAVSRVCAGVHFPRDVVVGYLYPVAVAVVFYYFV